MEWLKVLIAPASDAQILSVASLSIRAIWLQFCRSAPVLLLYAIAQYAAVIQGICMETGIPSSENFPSMHLSTQHI
jgi:hypothetical protein